MTWEPSTPETIRAAQSIIEKLTKQQADRTAREARTVARFGRWRLELTRDEPDLLGARRRRQR